MDSSLDGDLNAQSAKVLPAETVSATVCNVSSEAAGLAALHPSSVLPSLEEKGAWPEWARGDDSNVRSLAPRRAAAGAFGFSRTLIGWSVWRDRAPAPLEAARPTVPWIVATAAGTSLAVSLMTVWLFGPEGTVRSEPVGTVTVSYEPLEGFVRQPVAAALPIEEDRDLDEPEPAAASTVPAAAPTALPPALSLPPAAPTALPPALSVPAAAPTALPPALPVPAAASTPSPITTEPPTAAARTPETSGTAAPRTSGTSGTSAVRKSATTGTAAATTWSGLEVITEPEGARVTINGLAYGTSPLTVREMPPGAKRIRVTKDGYGGEERLLGAEAARSTTSLRIVLHEIPADRGPH